MKLLVLSMSGGLDSSTLCARALKEGFTVLPVNYIYGQKNRIETKAQENIYNFFKDNYKEQLLETISIDLTTTIGDSIKTWQENRDSGKLEETTQMEYYMPSRNLLFMVLAGVIGEIITIDKDIKELHLGLGIHKHSDIYARDYWDISPKFANKLNDLLSLNDNVSMQIYAPYANEFKSEIIEDSIKLNVPHYLTWTCYNPELVSSDDYQDIYKPCGICEACKERESQSLTTPLVNMINDYTLTIKKDI